jgi:hypothetical protein
MERSTKELIGFGDLPDELFFFKDEMSIAEAFEKSKDIDNKKIQETYRSIYTLERTVNAVKNILTTELKVPETINEYHLKTATHFNLNRYSIDDKVHRMFLSHSLLFRPNH